MEVEEKKGAEGEAKAEGAAEGDKAEGAEEQKKPEEEPTSFTGAEDALRIVFCAEYGCALCLWAGLERCLRRCLNLRLQG